MGVRRRARELALRVLFHLEYHQDDPGSAFELICKEFNASRKIQSFARELILGVCENIKEIDRIIGEASRNWRIERMSHVDRNLLRISTYEILYREDIPPKASINEAVELGKKYGQEDSAAFINGILDSIYKRYRISLVSDPDVDSNDQGSAENSSNRK